MPTTCLTLNPLGNDKMATWCNSWATQDGKVHVPVNYDWKTIDRSEGSDPSESIQQGADLLNSLIAEHISGGPVWVFGHSKGAQVIGRWLIKYGATSGFSAANLKFVCTGNPTSPLGHVPWVKFPQPTNGVGVYSVIDIGRQWDGWCRWPSTSNFFTIIKAISGMFSVHPRYNVSLNSVGVPTSGVISTQVIGNTTCYTIN